MHIILVNVDELWLKGKNRKMYFNTLKKQVGNICQQLTKVSFRLKNENQRIVIKTEDENIDGIISSLTRLPGIYSVQPAFEIELDKEKISQKCIELVDEELADKTKMSFKVETKRINKTFPYRSMDFSREVGADIWTHFQDRLFVRLKEPELTINIKINYKSAFINSKTFYGVGGLPVGTSGHGITMLSGGFDSPVASYQMSTRGLFQTFVFFHAYPYVGDEVKDKIIELAKVLGTYQHGSNLYVVPFGDIQNIIAQNCDEKYRTLLFRWAMVKFSNLLASKIDAKAIVTGDSLGQVSSQTLENMMAIDSQTDIPILRPLVGTHKKDIILTSKKIGTHDISIIPHDDACSMFAPAHPVIRANMKYWSEVTAQLSEKLNDVLTETLEKSDKIYLPYC